LSCHPGGGDESSLIAASLLSPQALARNEYHYFEDWWIAAQCWKSDTGFLPGTLFRISVILLEAVNLREP
jgi:hypothetical protein